MTLDTHRTAAELYDTVRRRPPGIGISMVYRNLERMVAKVERTSGYEMVRHSTEFFGVCTECGEVA